MCGTVAILSDFNPRSREGSDGGAAGERRAKTHFNPRSREGSDLIAIFLPPFTSRISIHAPARGATQKDIVNTVIKIDFNPRSREGSDVQASEYNLRR